MTNSNTKSNSGDEDDLPLGLYGAGGLIIVSVFVSYKLSPKLGVDPLLIGVIAVSGGILFAGSWQAQVRVITAYYDAKRVNRAHRKVSPHALTPLRAVGVKVWTFCTVTAATVWNTATTVTQTVTEAVSSRTEESPPAKSSADTTDEGSHNEP